ncbi:sensor histidine kinase [Paenirhodobacter populi]|uniref:histidine kinase n=1 Tax=Paenirhodobacter populi TaxID=2306993 RepID=A0A451GCV0_9RHOB|nr:ATP-binding protein [Sinirhodobacter populi]RWR13269.1 PAS domain-containing protein [Sinirhodobacter populi]
MTRALTFALVDALPFALLIVDDRERITWANPVAADLFGRDLVGRTFVTALRQPSVGEALETALKGGGGDRVRLRIQTTRREISAVVTTAPLPADQDMNLPYGGAMVTIEDVTALEDAEAMRRDFVANVSHELRTPLTALMGFIETLRGNARDDPAARDRFLGIMEREAARMNRLVGDLLSLSRVEAEERRVPTTEVDLSAVLKGAMQTLAPTAETRGVALLREGETGRLPVRGDPDQLTQVFANLIENGIKYGGSGGEVRITVTRVAHEPVLRGPALRVEVADKGEGIDEIHLPRLTERFYRVDTHRSREQGGTGLGLAIVKHIVSRHRGRLKIDSRKGEGSRFVIVLPAL